MEQEQVEIAESKPLYVTPYDRFGRKTLSDPIIAADFLRYYADPVIARSIARCVDLDHLVSEPTHLFGPPINDNPFKEVILDVPYTARLRDEAGNAEVLIVFEHKSAPNDFIPLQLNAYANLSLYDKWIKAGRPRKKGTFKLPIPLMAVVYCGAEDTNVDVQYQDMYDNIPKDLQGFVPQHWVIGINLRRFEYGKLPGRPETQAIVETMKRAFDGTLADHLSNILGYFSPSTLDERIESLMVSICAFCAIVTDIEAEQIDKVISDTVQGQRGIQMVLTARQSIWQTGFDSGVAKGKLEGMVKGKVETILSLLSARFQDIPQQVTDSLNTMTDPITLNSLAIRAATSTSLDDFTESLQ